jgi:hypothetical protein
MISAATRSTIVMTIAAIAAMPRPVSFVHCVLLVGVHGEVENPLGQLEHMAQRRSVVAVTSANLKKEVQGSGDEIRPYIVHGILPTD